MMEGQKTLPSTKRALCIFRAASGFSIVELVVAASVFALVSTSLAGIFIYAVRVPQALGEAARAALLAEEGLEAVRNIRDDDFSSLSDGTHGLSASGGEWVLAGAEDTSGIFVRQIVITTVDENTKDVRSVILWDERGRERSVALRTLLSHWQYVVPQSKSLSIDVSGQYIPQKSEKDIKGLSIENTGTFDIVLDAMIVSWTTVRRIDNVSIGGSLVWSSSKKIGSPAGTPQPSGTELDIVDVVLPAGQGPVPIDFLSFTGSMKDEVLDITFIMDDGSEKTVAGIAPSIKDE